jgi:TRAP-type C4-dicarboxylate transport system permease large subunit
MSEIIQTFVAGILAGIVMTCILFAGAFFRALRGWERAQNRIEDLETQLEQLQSDAEEDWR